MKYKRILLKISGESLTGDKQNGIEPKIFTEYCNEIAAVVKQNVQIAIVIGGGNIFRGLEGAGNGIGRIQGDYMGMLATVINSMAIQSYLEKQGLKTALMGGLAIEPVCEKMNSRKAIEYLEEGKVVIISGGTGNPFFTTDTAAALRAVEIHADVILKGTRVDGIYTTDPEKDPNAKRFDTLTFDETIKRQLNVMDLTAFTLCRENNLSIVVFNMNQPGNLLKVVRGEKIGTYVGK